MGEGIQNRTHQKLVLSLLGLELYSSAVFFWRHLNSWPANVRTYSVSQLSFNCVYKNKRERTIELTRSFSSEAVLKFRPGLPPHSLLSLPCMQKKTYQRPCPCTYENFMTGKKEKNNEKTHQKVRASSNRMEPLRSFSNVVIILCR